MALIQYKDGAPSAIHVTRDELERLRRVSVHSAGLSALDGLRVYVLPDPVPPLRWWQRAWAWLYNRWSEWNARVLRPETAPMSVKPVSKAITTPYYRWQLPFYGLCVNKSAAITIISSA